MKMKFAGLLSLLVIMTVTTSALAKVVSKPIEYQDGKTKLRGYISFDNSIKEKKPAVLVVHEWWGLNKYARDRAKLLAKLGYVVFALDMYGKGKLAKHPDEAKAFSSQFQDSALMVSRFDAAYKLLANHKRVDASKIAAIGYCFGGKVVLEMARAGKNLVAVGSFHGALATKNPAKKGKVKANIFVAHGEADKFVPEKDLQAFRQEMQAAKLNASINTYKNAMHSFTVPHADEVGKKFNLPLKYDEQADKDSWKKWISFLANSVSKE